MVYTYVLQCKHDGRWYTGSTRDLKLRLQDHTLGKVASTKNRGPFVLIYFEACLADHDARLREKFLKSTMGKRYLRRRLKTFFGI